MGDYLITGLIFDRFASIFITRLISKSVIRQLCMVYEVHKLSSSSDKYYLDVTK